MPRITKAEKLAAAAKRDARNAENRAIITANRCPQCGAGLRRNLAITGWWTCEQRGDGHFRKDQSKPGCSWMCILDSEY